MPESTSSFPAADRDMLFGVLALQMDFIDRDAFIKGMNAWVLEKRKPLGQILVEQHALGADEHARLEALVKKHLQKHGNDAQQSLAAVGTHGLLRRALELVADADLHASLAHVAAAPDAADPSATCDFVAAPDAADPSATCDFAVGTPTSSGQRFRVLRPHARGGLGEVFVARDEELDREVALKEIQQEHADRPEHRARFLLEAQVTGRLEHPGIVPVYGLGTYTDGRPFYAMRFIKGDSLKDAIEQFHAADTAERDPGERQLALRQLLGRFLNVCNAIAYAHSRGVLHRDLKPGNVMLGSFGETLVVDWGLAKVLGRADGNGQAGESMLHLPALSDSAETVAGTFLGTAAYTSPEQAAGRLEELSAASDVYSLGATLYSLLTGKAPFGSGPVGEVLRKVQRGEFTRPRQVKVGIPPALEAICLKAMALAPQDRYATPRLLADDLEHWLADEPVTAYREPWSARLGRWARQHKVLVGWAGAVGAVAATAVVAALLVMDARGRQEQEQLLREAAERNEAEADRQRGLAEEQRGLARRYLYNSRMDLAQREWQAARIGRVLELLEEHRTPRAGEEDLRGFEWYYLWHLCHRDLLTLKGHTNGVHSVAFSPDGKRLASGSMDGTVKLWDSGSGQEQLTLKGHANRVLSVAFSPDGKRLASSSLDQTVKLWDSDSGQELLTLKGHTGRVLSVAFSPDGKRLASASDDQTVKLWDSGSGQEQLTLKGHTNQVWSVAFSPDGKRLASGSWDQTMKLWDSGSGQELLALKGHTGGVRSVAFSPDGKRLASGSWDRTMKLWDSGSGQELLTLKGHTSLVNSVVFSPDGKRLASGSWDRTVKLWDSGSGQELLTLKGHANTVWSLAFSPDGKRLASASEDQTVKLWDSGSGQEQLTLKGHTNPVVSVAFSPDGKRLASASEDRTVKLWDSGSGQELLTLKGHTREVYSVAFSPDGKRLASGSYDQTVKLWDSGSGQELLTLRGHTGDVGSVAFSPDGKRLASGSFDRTVKLWDSGSGQELLTLRGHTNWVWSVAFSPDGKRLASASWDQTVKLWDSGSGQERLTLKGHSDRVTCVAFSPDGKRLASGSWDQTVKLWDSSSGQELLALKGHTSVVWSVAFSPDGKRLA